MNRININQNCININQSEASIYSLLRKVSDYSDI